MRYPMRSALDVLNAAYEELYGEPLELITLLKDLLFDFGVDGAGLTLQDCIDAFNDGESTRWSRMHNACSAVLARYSASNQCTNIEFVRSLAAMFILSRSIRRGYGDLEFSFDIMIRIFESNSEKCNFTIRMDALRTCFCDISQL